MGARMVKYPTKTGDEITTTRNDELLNMPMKKIWGKVKDWNGNPAPDAIIRLYKIKPDKELEFIRQVFSDNSGKFDLGLVKKDIDYTLKVWYKDAKVKKVILAQQELHHNNYEDYEDYGGENENDEEE